MSQSNQHDDILYELLGALCNETITEGQHQQLEQILSTDMDAREKYFNYLDLHLNLKRMRDEIPETELEFLPVRRSMRASQSVWKNSQMLLLMGTMVCITLVIGLLMLTQPPSIPPQVSQSAPVDHQTAVAKVTQTASVRFAEGAPFLKVGSPVKIFQEYALSEGQIQLVFANGAEVILGAPVVFESEHAMHLSVRYGSCSVFVPEGAEGFTVETPLSNVVDFGTRFSVNVSETGSTDVQVIEGEADVRPLNSGHQSQLESKRLTKGMAQRLLTNNGLIVEDIPFDDARYIAQLPDRVVSYTTTLGPEQRAEDLVDVTVQRGGKIYEYAVEDMIGIDLIHYKGGSFITRNDGIDPGADGDPETLRRHLIDRDRSLLTGIINPAASKTPLTVSPVMNEIEDPQNPNTPGMAIRFREPVVNDAGPDIVLFDLQVIVHNTAGDPFFVTPLPFTSNRKTHKIGRFDIDLASSEAKLLEKFWLHIFTQKSGVSSLSELESAPGNGGKWHVVGAKALAVGIDLSDLGFAEGELVEGLFIQDVQDDKDYVDPIFIAGLPALKNADN